MAGEGWAVAGEYFDGGRDSYGLNIPPNSAGFIARPYFNTNSAVNANDAILVNGPNELSGSAFVA